MAIIKIIFLNVFAAKADLEGQMSWIQPLKSVLICKYLQDFLSPQALLAT